MNLFKILEKREEALNSLIELEEKAGKLGYEFKFINGKFKCVPKKVKK